jgi:hypothetical protein
MHNVYTIFIVSYFGFSKTQDVAFCCEPLARFRQDTAACVSLSFINNVKERGGLNLHAPKFVVKSSGPFRVPG